MRQPTEQDAQADHAVADDHHGSVDRVARQARRVIAAGNHHREDERGLDCGDRQGEDECAEGLADAMCDDFGVVHRHDDRRHESGGAEHRDPRSDSREHCRDQHTKRQDGNERGEWRHCSTCAHCGCEARRRAIFPLGPRLRRGTRPRQFQ